jgi:hypothetical protein
MSLFSRKKADDFVRHVWTHPLSPSLQAEGEDSLICFEFGDVGQWEGISPLLGTLLLA